MSKFCINCVSKSDTWPKFVTVAPLSTLLWRQNGHDGVSNHQPHHCLLNRLFTRRSKRTSKLRGTGLCVRNSPVIGEFPTQVASNAENVSIWWRHHDIYGAGQLNSFHGKPSGRAWAESDILRNILDFMGSLCYWKQLEYNFAVLFNIYSTLSLSLWHKYQDSAASPCVTKHKWMSRASATTITQVRGKHWCTQQVTYLFFCYTMQTKFRS